MQTRMNLDGIEYEVSGEGTTFSITTLDGVPVSTLILPRSPADEERLADLAMVHLASGTDVILPGTAVIVDHRFGRAVGAPLADGSQHIRFDDDLIECWHRDSMQRAD